MPRRMYWRFTRWERDRSSAWSRSWRPRRRASRPGSPNPASRPAWHRACRTFGAHVGLQRTSLPLWRDRRSQDAAMRVSDGCSDRLRLVGCDHRAGLAVDAPRKPPGTSTVASLRCLRGAAAWMLGAASARVRSATRHWKQMRSHLWQVSKLLPLCSTCPPVPPPPGTGDKFASPWGHYFAISVLIALFVCVSISTSSSDFLHLFCLGSPHQIPDDFSHESPTHGADVGPG